MQQGISYSDEVRIQSRKTSDRIRNAQGDQLSRFTIEDRPGRNLHSRSFPIVWRLDMTSCRKTYLIKLKKKTPFTLCDGVFFVFVKPADSVDDQNERRYDETFHDWKEKRKKCQNQTTDKQENVDDQTLHRLQFPCKSKFIDDCRHEEDESEKYKTSNLEGRRHIIDQMCNA